MQGVGAGRRGPPGAADLAPDEPGQVQEVVDQASLRLDVATDHGDLVVESRREVATRSRA